MRSEDIASQADQINPNLYLGHQDDLVRVIRGIGIDVAGFTALVMNALGDTPNKAGRTLLRLCFDALMAELKIEQNADAEEQALRYLASR